MNKKLYLVTFDGYIGGYGVSYYSLGVFTTREAAENAINMIDIMGVSPVDLPDLKKRCQILEMDLDVIQNIKRGMNGDLYYTTDSCIGQYIE